MKNPGLNALTVEEERREFAAVVTPANIFSRLRAIAATKKGHKISFAFMQSDFQGGFIPYWHVTDPKSPSYQSTLSIEGLKTWGILK